MQVFPKIRKLKNLQEDWLYFFPMVAIYLPKWKIIKIILHVFTWLLLGNFCFSAFQIAHRYNFEFLISNLLPTLLLLNASLANGTLVLRNITYEELKLYLVRNMCAADGCGAECKNKIMKLSIQYKIIAVCLFLCASAVSFLMIIREEAISVWYIVTYINENDYMVAPLFRFLLKYCVFMIPITTQLPALFYQYVVIQIASQLVLLRYMVNEICNKEMGQNDVRDAVFQDNIRKRLIFCIVRHVEILSVIERLKRVIYWDNILQTPFGVLLISSIILWLYYGISTTSSLHITILGILSLATILTMYAYCYVGQALDDSMEGLLNSICNLEWYKMSPANRKYVCIFMNRSQKFDYIVVIKMIGIKSDLILEQFRVAWTIFTFLLTFKSDAN